MPQTIFAADLGGTKLSAALIDRRGKIVARRIEPVDRRSAEAPVKQICRLAMMLARPRRGKLAFRAAGVAVPGLVRRTGTVWAPNLPGWQRVPLARILAARLRVPVVVESDRNAAVLGEAWRGAAQGKSDAIVLIVGTGIGAGILSGGAIVRGAHELSGCAGWMVLGEERRAEFRRVGWLEAQTAGPAVARAARLRRAQSAEEIAKAARRGETRARKVFAHIAKLLGLACANLISLFDPEVIVLGGGMAGAADLFFRELRRVALANSQPLAARQVRLVITRLGDRANLLGAARLAWEAAQRTKSKRGR